MKKIILVILLFLALNSYSQIATNNDYKKSVKFFYSLLFKKNVTIGEFSKIYANGGIDNEAQEMICDSLKMNFYNYQWLAKKAASINDSMQSVLIKGMRLSILDLTQGLKLQRIYKLIDKAKILDEGLGFDEYLELDFPNGKTVYFDLDAGNENQINGIYLDNGNSLSGNLYNHDHAKLYLVGTINDPDGYVNIRESPFAKSKITGRIESGNYFYYCPDSNSDWWMIAGKENGPKLGYIHKSCIKNYMEFSNKLKAKVIKERNS